MNNSVFHFPPSAAGRFLKSSYLTALLLAAGAMAGFAGCRPFDYYGQTLQAPVSPDMEPPR